MSDWTSHPATKRLLAVMSAYGKDFDEAVHAALLKGDVVEAQAANSKVELINMLDEAVEEIKEGEKRVEA